MKRITACTLPLHPAVLILKHHRPPLRGLPALRHLLVMHLPPLLLAVPVWLALQARQCVQTATASARYRGRACMQPGIRMVGALNTQVTLILVIATQVTYAGTI